MKAGTTMKQQTTTSRHTWYQACVDFHMSVPEYRKVFSYDVFTEDMACNAIDRLAGCYKEKEYGKDPDYLVRMDHLLEVIREHDTEEAMIQWRIWLKYFVTMGAGEWNAFWHSFLM